MDQLEIYIESLTGSLLQFQVSPFETVLSLKEKIQNVQGIPVNHQHLVHQDRELDNDLSLYNYNIQNGSTLRLILHMRGGPISTRPLTADLTSQQTLLEEMASEYMESLTGENWPTSGADGGTSVASGVSGDSETQTDARATSTASASPTPVPPSSQPHPRHVTLLVLRDGDQLNFYRVVDRSASCIVPSGSSAIAPFDALISPSASALGDDQSSSASEATLNGSGSCFDASVQSLNTNDNLSAIPVNQNAELRFQDQRVIEDRTRQKMAELRSRMMANSKQVQITQQSHAGAIASGLTTTPVLMPRPPSTAQRTSLNASRTREPDQQLDKLSRPYVPTAMSTLRRRRISSQQSVPASSSPSHPAVTSPRDVTGPSANGNFASLADYFRSKEVSGQQDTVANGPATQSVSSSTSPLRKVKPGNQMPIVPSDVAQTSSAAISRRQQEVVRCSPYLRELFAGTRFFVVDQDQKEGNVSVPEKPLITQNLQDRVLTDRTIELNSGPDVSSYNHVPVDPVIPERQLEASHTTADSVIASNPAQQQSMEVSVKTQNTQHLRTSVSQTGSAVPSRTVSRQQTGANGPRANGLANAFAALIERQTSQTASQSTSSGQPVSNTNGGRKTGSTVRSQHQQNSSEGDGDVDVLERALTTLLLKAELEHLGTSRLPIGLMPPPIMPSAEVASDQRAPVHHAKAPNGPRTSVSRQGMASNLSLGSGAAVMRGQALDVNRATPVNVSSTGDMQMRKPIELLQNSLSQQQPPPTSAATRLPVIAPQARAAVSTTRCAVCNRRTGLATTYICRCSATFCTVHRYPEAHHCTYDYKGEGRRAIQANNPVITADKLPKI